MNNKELAREWFSTGDMDLESAAFLQKMRPAPAEIICYHCQQCAEKYLKGFIALYGKEIPRVHDLVVLNKRCFDHEKEFKMIQDHCIDLTDYGIQMRYPFHIEVEERDAVKALNDAQAIKDFVLLHF